MAFIQKRSNDTGAAHHPYVFARQGSNAFRELGNRLLNELKAEGDFFWRSTREGVVLDRTIRITAIFAFLLKPQHHVVSLSSPQNRIDRAIELAHAVVAFKVRTIQPINGAITSRDEAVGTGGDVDDDLSHDEFRANPVRPVNYELLFLLRTSVAAKLCCAVQHARLVAHQQRAHAIPLDRRKDFAYRVRD